MSTKTKSSFLLRSLLIVIGLPLLILLLGHFPERTMLKESISFLTLVAFFLTTGQFFWTRINKTATTAFETQPKSLKAIHNLIGCTCITILSFHPFLLVVPRFFENGPSPFDAFATIITTFTSKGIILGLIAWVLMIIIGFTSIFRKKLPIRYLNWRKLHTIFSLLFIIVASWHVINLGRHVDTALSVVIIALSGGSVLLVLKEYLIMPITKIGTKQ